MHEAHPPSDTTAFGVSYGIPRFGDLSWTMQMTVFITYLGGSH